MKTLLALFFVLTSYSAVAAGPGTKVKQLQRWILESISEMPQQGGYELSLAPANKLRDAFSWEAEFLFVDPSLAQPSYCTTATYLIFYKTLEKYWESTNSFPETAVLEKLKPNLEDDGFLIWGRWNANGPGTAKLFFDAKLGKNFDDIKLAKAGDFLKIYWNDQVGKFEKGHTVIFLREEVVAGVPMIRFWGSSKSTFGYGEKLIPKSDAIRMLFSRLEFPENISLIKSLPEEDAFLASMLTKVSNWSQVKKVSGMR
ncbi:MAG TPA: hypothetical protein VNJ01_10940 [Bacteriovoracaceae bacterium]|nr:hypothetical protein [Bacteriovoracaceae bacterium]